MRQRQHALSEAMRKQPCQLLPHLVIPVCLLNQEHDALKEPAEALGGAGSADRSDG